MTGTHIGFTCSRGERASRTRRCTRRGANDDGDGLQSWEYNNLTALWGPDLGLRTTNPAALKTLQRGGYYSVQVVPGLTVVSLNINYWVKQNPEAAKPDSAAAKEGLRMMTWLADELEAAQQRGDAVHVLGHQPPASNDWVNGYWAQYSRLITQFNATIRGQFFGHIHVDEWNLVRECRNHTGNPNASYIETSGGIKWCSGGGDVNPGDVFGAGMGGLCPLVPAGWSADKAAKECERVCTAHTACVGFTLCTCIADCRLL